MKHITKLLPAGVLGLALAAVTLSHGAETPGQDTGAQNGVEQDTTPPAPADQGENSMQTPPVDPPVIDPPPAVAPSTPPAVELPVVDQTPTPTPTPPDRLEISGRDIETAVAEVLAKVRAERAEYLAFCSSSLRSMKEKTATERATLREAIQLKREAFLSQQRDNRAELKQALEQIRTRLAEHSELIDAVKQEAKAKANERKGGIAD